MDREKRQKKIPPWREPGGGMETWKSVVIWLAFAANRISLCRGSPRSDLLYGGSFGGVGVVGGGGAQKGGLLALVPFPQTKKKRL